MFNPYPIAPSVDSVETVTVADIKRGDRIAYVRGDWKGFAFVAETSLNTYGETVVTLCDEHGETRGYGTLWYRTDAEPVRRVIPSARYGQEA